MFGPLRLLLQKILCGQNQFLALARIDAAECAAPLCVQPVADFGEYYCIAVKHDQIQLTTFTRPVLRHQAQAL
ncbi:hypothetical protein D9M73_257200 [compost metagenome]